MKLTRNFLLFIAAISISCSRYHEYDKVFDSAIIELKPDFGKEGLNAIVIIPGIGCSGCISYVESFLKDNYDNKVGVKFILTRIESKKMLIQNTGIDLKNENVIVDDLNVFSKGVYNSIYPTFIFFNSNGRISEIVYASTDENGLEVLINQFFDESIN